MIKLAVRRNLWIVVFWSIGFLVELPTLRADEPVMVDLVGDHGLDAWRQPTGDN